MMLDQVRKQCAARALEGVGKIPALTSITVSTTKRTVGLTEGWVLKQVKKAMWFQREAEIFLSFQIQHRTGYWTQNGS